MIRAQATVNQQRLGGRFVHIFHVYVSSPDSDQKRKYVLIAHDEDKAAQEGLRRYCAELDPDPILKI